MGLGGGKSKFDPGKSVRKQREKRPNHLMVFFGWSELYWDVLRWYVGDQWIISPLIKVGW